MAGGYTKPQGMYESTSKCEMLHQSLVHHVVVLSSRRHTVKFHLVARIVTIPSLPGAAAAPTLSQRLVIDPKVVYHYF